MNRKGATLNDWWEDLSAKPLLSSNDPILEVLPTDAKVIYLQSISEQIRKSLLRALEGTKRWKNDDTDRVIDPNFTENNLEHVLDLISWANLVACKYPNLYMELTSGDRRKWLDLLTMLIIHDLGEAVTGDICRTHSQFDGEYGYKHKHREARAAKKLLVWGAKEQSGELLELYGRYEARKPDDILVRFGHVLDKGQASKNVAKHIVPFNPPVRQGSYRLDREIIESIEAPMSYTSSVVAGLKSQNSKQEFAAFLNDFFLNDFRDLSNKIEQESYEAIWVAVQVKYRDVLI